MFLAELQHVQQKPKCPSKVFKYIHTKVSVMGAGCYNTNGCYNTSLMLHCFITYTNCYITPFQYIDKEKTYIRKRIQKLSSYFLRTLFIEIHKIICKLYISIGQLCYY